MRLPRLLTLTLLTLTLPPSLTLTGEEATTPETEVESAAVKKAAAYYVEQAYKVLDGSIAPALPARGGGGNAPPAEAEAALALGAEQLEAARASRADAERASPSAHKYRRTFAHSIV